MEFCRSLQVCPSCLSVCLVVCFPESVCRLCSVHLLLFMTSERLVVVMHAFQQAVVASVQGFSFIWREVTHSLTSKVLPAVVLGVCDPVDTTRAFAYSGELGS